MSNKVTILIPEGTNSATILSKSVIGPEGPAGQPGEGILNGAGPPNIALGSNGSFYYDTTNFVFYGPKDSNGWGSGLDLTSGSGVDTSDITLTYTGDLLTRLDRASGAFKDFTYDSNGVLQTIFDGALTKTFLYDSNGFLTQITFT